MNKKAKIVLFTVLFFIVAIVVAIFVIKRNNAQLLASAPELVVDEAYLISICQPACTEEVIYHPNYWLCYSEEDEQAKWVATVLSAYNILKPTVERSDKFTKDPLITTESAVTGDYTGSGYDRGHLLSFASNGWNDEVGQASFYMSNMSPQAPNTNRYTYEKLEEAERTATVQNEFLCVVHGPVLEDGPFKKIGKTSEISVPNYYYVCFLDMYGDSQKAIGFIIPNDNVNYKDITQFAVSVDTIEEKTGLDFWPLLPDEIENSLESSYDVSLWDLSSFNRTKVAEKYGYNLNNLI